MKYNIKEIKLNKKVIITEIENETLIMLDDCFYYIDDNGKIFLDNIDKSESLDELVANLENVYCELDYAEILCDIESFITDFLANNILLKIG